MQYELLVNNPYKFYIWIEGFHCHSKRQVVNR